MGQGDSKPHKQFLEGFQQQYQLYLDNQEDLRLGKIQIYKGQGSLVVVKRCHTHNKEEIETYIENNLKRALLNYVNCSYLLKVLSYEEQEDQAMCGSISELKIYLEYHSNNLESEIQQRNKNLMCYSEQELLVILYSIIQASSFLEEQGKTINDIRPQNIYLTKAGQLRLVPFEIFYDDVPIYGKVLQSRYPFYIAPEQLQELRENKIRSSADPFKADIFSVGITMLQAATLQSGIDCYDMTNLQLNRAVIQQLQSISSRRYSQFFNKLINVMLLEDPSLRPTPGIMSKILKPFEEPILGLTPFTPNEDAVRQSLYGSSSQFQQPQLIQSQPSPYQNVQQQLLQSQSQPSQQVIVQQVPAYSDSPLKSVNYQFTQQPQFSQSQLQIQQQPQQLQQQYAYSQPLQQPQVINYSQNQQQVNENSVRYIQVDESQQPRRNTVYYQQQQSPQYVRAQTQQEPLKQLVYQEQPQYEFKEQIQNQSPIRLIQGPQNGQYVQVVQQQPLIQQNYSPIQNQYTEIQQGQQTSHFQPQPQPQYQRLTHTQQSYAQQQSPQFLQSFQPQPSIIPQQQNTVSQLPSQYYQQPSVRYEDGLQTIQRHQQSGGVELSEIDRRINEVLQKTQNTLEKVDHSSYSNYHQ